METDGIAGGLKALGKYYGHETSSLNGAYFWGSIPLTVQHTRFSDFEAIETRHVV